MRTIKHITKGKKIKYANNLTLTMEESKIIAVIIDGKNVGFQVDNGDIVDKKAVLNTKKKLEEAKTELAKRIIERGKRRINEAIEIIYEETKEIKDAEKTICQKEKRGRK